ncbi:hypothetical protein BJ878DRAFT_38366 [Calycina marina]|uniref:Uncharacterized protein n=1 Tax=Calycina marina TaxID=1763456 RepID=A0A9P8CFN8_9HELO|nr:hypothetical protein BJ878DRAFT_38366 [Calycina marina]
MPPQLKSLLLPHLIGEQRKRGVKKERERESALAIETDLSSNMFNSQSSTASVTTSPLTPTFSNRGHLRYPSSSSSIETPFSGSMNESTSSQTCVSKPGRRSLPDVQEEPQDERDQDFDMLETATVDLYDCPCEDCQLPHDDKSKPQSSEQLSTSAGLDYDTMDVFFGDGELAASPRPNKRRAIEPPTGFATRFGNKFPSISHKWRSRKPHEATPTLPSSSDLPSDRAASRNVSNRSSIVFDPIPSEYQMPPTPTKSVFESQEHLPVSHAIDIERANRMSTGAHDNLATTPLLPPLMLDASANMKQAAVQSPLQSPSVAESSDPFSGSVTPIDSITTPQLFGVPSPPLSTKPSVSSFHRSTMNRPSHLIPSSEIPNIKIGDPVDEWSHKLGHANFTIHPEPYVPEIFDLEACRQLRAHWDLARTNYMKHLVRTGEHYGVTSNTYKHTEEKWAVTDLKWRINNDTTIANTVDNSSDPFATLKHTKLGDGNNNIMTKLPSLNDTRCTGKFPLLGDGDIVGPMVQAASQLRRTPSKKSKFYKFIADKFPVGLPNRT